MASFSTLPNELLEQIVARLSQHDTSSFCRLNSHLHILATPFLYRHVDLFVPPSNKLPRIDYFCLNILQDARKASNVRSIRLGVSSGESVTQGQRQLPHDSSFDHAYLLQKAMDIWTNETMFPTNAHLKEALETREYSAYAALIILILPSLQHLHVTDCKSTTYDYLQALPDTLAPESLGTPRFLAQSLVRRLSSITHTSLVFDQARGIAYRDPDTYLSADHFLNLPNIQSLELSVRGGLRHQSTLSTNVPLIRRIRPTNITTLVFRHSGAFIASTRSLFQCIPRLRSLTYDFVFDGRSMPDPVVNLAAWCDVLQAFQSTLEILVFSIEYCDKLVWFYSQPRISMVMNGHLNMTHFPKLDTLEVPLPFLTGDPEFTMETPVAHLLPPNLRHLTLRTDLSHAQHAHPFDTSILQDGLSVKSSQRMANYLMSARSDVSVIYQTSLTLLEQATTLESLSIWQPADPSLAWLDSQTEDFATTCRNTNISGKILIPMLLRWKNAAHWDLMQEKTVFDREAPGLRPQTRFWRKEWEGRPLGLATQYLLHALRFHPVKL
ncbi:hypothetical protein COCMIDRAFT_94890 [Bipolaris oryzae ATCC 44560]|uniref:F-box domain-containing protein n=1 Tax=Bipolaris oryzae ATCC 44560 TaxID=930090 RepID=W6ZE22_COCMI|nr:uncharacterized protein COCMIDRAFT_94890 [Bipolaris oryzae ATCC 44560]EUC45714.1 hypothetical protein COCMIDRAFT_94890 [Bipolaris oryzae ATCC 44560]